MVLQHVSALHVCEAFWIFPQGLADQHSLQSIGMTRTPQMMLTAVLQEYRRTSPQAYTTLVAMYCFFIAAGGTQAKPGLWHSEASKGVEQGRESRPSIGAV